MKKRRFIWLALLFLSLGFAAALISRPVLPVDYQGRDVWQWAVQHNSPSQPKRDEAAAVLRQLGPRAVPELLRKLRAEESIPRKVRLWLASWLPARAGRALTKDLERISFSNVRSTAAIGLRALGTNANDAVPALLKALRGTDLQLTWDAASALGSIGEGAVLGLIPLLEVKNGCVRHAAAYALGEIGPPALPAVPALIRRLGDADPNVRASTLYTLSRIGPQGGPAALKAVAENRGEARRAAARAVVAIHPRGMLALPVLLAMAHDPEPETRSVAIYSLGTLQISHTNALAAYREALRDTNAAVRASAATALGGVSWKTAAELPALTQLELSDGDEAVRQAARQAIEKITAPSTNAARKL